MHQVGDQTKVTYYMFYNLTTMYMYIKAIPLQAWTGPEGSRRLRFPDFKIIGT